MNLFSQQGLVLLVGVLLLAAPLFGKVFTLWVTSLIWSPTKRDFETQTVVNLMELRNSLDKEGYRNASALCRDLVFAVVYGDEKRGQ